MVCSSLVCYRLGGDVTMHCRSAARIASPRSKQGFGQAFNNRCRKRGFAAIRQNFPRQTFYKMQKVTFLIFLVGCSRPPDPDDLCNNCNVLATKSIKWEERVIPSSFDGTYFMFLPFSAFKSNARKPNEIRPIIMSDQNGDIEMTRGAQVDEPFRCRGKQKSNWTSTAEPIPHFCTKQ